MKSRVPLRISLPLFFPTLLLALGCASGASQSSAPGPGGVQASGTNGQAGNPTAIPTSQEQEDQDRPGIAVWPFFNGGSFGSDPWDYEALGIGLQQMLITELSLNSEPEAGGEEPHPGDHRRTRSRPVRVRRPRDYGQRGRGWCKPST